MTSSLHYGSTLWVKAMALQKAESRTLLYIIFSVLFSICVFGSALRCRNILGKASENTCMLEQNVLPTATNTSAAAAAADAGIIEPAHSHQTPLPHNHPPFNTLKTICMQLMRAVHAQTCPPPLSWRRSGVVCLVLA